MLRKTIYTALIVILTIGTAFAQTDKPMGLPGYSNAVRTDLEKKNDKEIDRAYQSTVKGTHAEKKKSDPWGDVRPDPSAAAKNKR